MSLWFAAGPAGAQAETGTVSFYVVSCPADVGGPGLYVADPVTGQNLPDGPLDGCADAASTIAFEGADGTTTSHDTASGDLTLPVGLYTLTDQSTGLTAEANVASGAETGVLLVLVDPEIESTATGTVGLTSKSCPRAAGVFTSDAINGNGIPAEEDWYVGCVDSTTILRFVQEGETVAQVDTSEGEVVLPEGAYLVVDETTGEDATVNVVPNVPAAVYAQQHDGTPLTGEVYLRAETCADGSAAVDRLIVADPVVGSLLPEGEGAYYGCEPTSAVFTFVDAAGTSSTFDVAEELVQLPEGLYTVTEDTTGLTAELNVINTAPATVYLRLVAEGEVTPGATVAPTVVPTATPAGVTGLPATGGGTSGMETGTGVPDVVLAGSLALAIALLGAGGRFAARR
jgi:hypothetical protein